MFFKPSRCPGGLFESGDEALELAFKYAIEMVNSDKNILPTTKLVAKVERLEKADSFQASRKGIFLYKKKIKKINLKKTIN